MNEEKNCYVEPVEKPIDREALSTAKVAFLAVWGMGCQRCATRVRNSLLSLDGVLMAEVELSQGMAAVAFEPQQVQVGDLLDAVAAAGNDGRHHYQAKFIKKVPAGRAVRILS